MSTKLTLINAATSVSLLLFSACGGAQTRPPSNDEVTAPMNAEDHAVMETQYSSGPDAGPEAQE